MLIFYEDKHFTQNKNLKTIRPAVGYIFMETNRLSPTLAQALNEQMTNEAHNAQIYLAYASWAADKGYDGISNFLFRHANEERNHMMKFLEYILKRGGKVVV